VVTKGIVIRGGRDIRIENCTFENLDTAIEAEGVVDLKLKGNKVVENRVRVKPYPKLAEVFYRISKLDIPEDTKKDLNKTILEAAMAAQERKLPKVKEREVLRKVTGALGRGAWEVVKAILAEAVAGKVVVWISPYLG
jgi:hypothetical protein